MLHSFLFSSFTTTPSPTLPPTLFPTPAPHQCCNEHGNTCRDDSTIPAFTPERGGGSWCEVLVSYCMPVSVPLIHSACAETTHECASLLTTSQRTLSSGRYQPPLHSVVTKRLWSARIHTIGMRLVTSICASLQRLLASSWRTRAVRSAPHASS